ARGPGYGAARCTGHQRRRPRRRHLSAAAGRAARYGAGAADRAFAQTASAGPGAADDGRALVYRRLTITPAGPPSARQVSVLRRRSTSGARYFLLVAWKCAPDQSGAVDIGRQRAEGEFALCVEARAAE